MTIQSASEFEVVVNHVVVRIEKALVQRGSIPALESAVRDFKIMSAAARTPAKLKSMRNQLDQLTDLLTQEIPDDNTLLEQLWDLADYFDYRT